MAGLLPTSARPVLSSVHLVAVSGHAVITAADVIFSALLFSLKTSLFYPSPQHTHAAVECRGICSGALSDTHTILLHMQFSPCRVLVKELSHNSHHGPLTRVSVRRGNLGVVRVETEPRTVFTDRSELQAVQADEHFTFFLVRHFNTDSQGPSVLFLGKVGS